MKTLSWEEKWQQAYENAGFYKSEKNTIEYWNEVARSGSSGLDGTDHIDMLIDYLRSNSLLDENSIVMDVGCGCGDYAIAFARYCKAVYALDNAVGMVEFCRDRINKEGITNVNPVHSDILESDHSVQDIFTPENVSIDIGLCKPNLVLATLVPATYCPDGFGKLLELTDQTVVYFTMDLPIDGSENEPIYRGTNSVVFAENYLREKGISYQKIPFVYDQKIPFAFLVVNLSK